MDSVSGHSLPRAEVLLEEPRPLCAPEAVCGRPLWEAGCARPSLGARGSPHIPSGPWDAPPTCPLRGHKGRLCPPSGSGAGPLLPCRWGLSANANAQVGTGRSHARCWLNTEPPKRGVHSARTALWSPPCCLRNVNEGPGPGVRHFLWNGLARRTFSFPANEISPPSPEPLDF